MEWRRYDTSRARIGHRSRRDRRGRCSVVGKLPLRAVMRSPKTHHPPLEKETGARAVATNAEGGYSFRRSKPARRRHSPALTCEAWRRNASVSFGRRRLVGARCVVASHVATWGRPIAREPVLALRSSRADRVAIIDSGVEQCGLSVVKWYRPRPKITNQQRRKRGNPKTSARSKCVQSDRSKRIPKPRNAR